LASLNHSPQRPTACALRTTKDGSYLDFGLQPSTSSDPPISVMGMDASGPPTNASNDLTDVVVAIKASIRPSESRV
jgi:hypothetical protein